MPIIRDTLKSCNDAAPGASFSPGFVCRHMISKLASLGLLNIWIIASTVTLAVDDGWLVESMVPDKGLVWFYVDVPQI